MSVVYALCGHSSWLPVSDAETVARYIDMCVRARKDVRSARTCLGSLALIAIAEDASTERIFYLYGIIMRIIFA